MRDRKRAEAANVGRRRLLEASAALAVSGLLAPGTAVAGRRRTLYGAGRVGEHLPGVTIPSPSDFGFSVDHEGGTFLCSMFGPETGGFLGCELMTTQGVVTPGSLELGRRAASFAGVIDVFVFPNVFEDPPGPWLSIAALDFRADVGLGGPDKGSLVLHIPAVAETIGGDTGGILSHGRISRRRTRR